MKKMAFLAAIFVLTILCTSFSPKLFSGNGFYIIIDKSDYELSVYDEFNWLVTYPVVFGNDNLGDKMMQGDNKTPEGTFKIILKKVHPNWCRFMLLDYPNKESIEKFNARKASGIIPKDAKIGGGIGIHGTCKNKDYQVDRYYNWTEGCISLRANDVKELYDMIPEEKRLS